MNHALARYPLLYIFHGDRANYVVVSDADDLNEWRWTLEPDDMPDYVGRRDYHPFILPWI